MSGAEIDIWFGPGGMRGVFGAGVAEGLQEHLDRQACPPRGLRLFGSSIGSLNALFLATGNTGCGLSIFQEDTRLLLRYDHLWPAVAVRARNRLRRWFGTACEPLPVPPVVDIDHVLRVMQRRTPDILAQLQASPFPVHCEVFDGRERRYRHLDLRQTAEPLEALRCSMTCHPFYCNLKTPDWLDSGIHGPGFVELLRSQPPRRLVVVMNWHPTRRQLRYLAADVAAAAIAATPRMAEYYLAKQARWRRALTRLQQHPDRVLLIFPRDAAAVGTAQSLAAMHAEGRSAAERIWRFWNK